MNRRGDISIKTRCQCRHRDTSFRSSSCPNETEGTANRGLQHFREMEGDDECGVRCFGEEDQSCTPADQGNGIRGDERNG